MYLFVLGYARGGVEPALATDWGLWYNQAVMRTASLISAALTVLAAFTIPAGAVTQFTAVIDAASNVPPGPSTATGTATLTLNDSQTQLTFHIEYSGLLSPEFAAHFHNASTRDNGPVAYELPLGTPKDGVWSIPANMVSELFAGKIYINIHTDVYYLGEIRGNIKLYTPVQEKTFGAIKHLYSAE